MIKKIILFFSIPLLFICTAVFAVNHPKITSYHQTFFSCVTQHNQLRIAIRAYYFDGEPYYLVVNPETLNTETATATECKSRTFPRQKLLATPYLQAVMKYTSSPYKMENAGMTHAENVSNGLFITADMCPSSKAFEKKFFNTLVTIANKNHQPTPIALSITGLWIRGHEQEFNWLIKQENENKLKITWINHSFSHPYYANQQLNKNFLLESHINTTYEILATEKMLLERGQLPSVFFRFPGLISNQQWMLKLRQYNLIPIGADAWLAKDQVPKPGSFILVHGNSNEPEGIKRIMPLLQNSENHWLPLNQAVTASSRF